MRPIIVALLMLLTIAVLPGTKVLAQNDCTTRCGDQQAICELAAEAALDECVDRAQTPREKANCANEFTKLADACRVKEAACLSNCRSE